MEIQSDVVFLYLKVMARGLPYDFKSDGREYLRYRGFVMKLIVYVNICQSFIARGP